MALLFSTIMVLNKFPIGYIQTAKDREKRTLAMASAHDIAFGISPLDKRKYKHNRHLWCYNTEALDTVEKWLQSLNVMSNPNFVSFNDFEHLYDFVLDRIGGIPGVSNVEVYDVSLYLGERITPQIVPTGYVYVHGKLVEAARHYLKYIIVSINKKEPRYRIKASGFGQIYVTVSGSPYAARAIEEWLCNEHDEIMKL